MTGVAGSGPSAREWQLFGVGTGLIWVHVVDHLVTEPRLGWSLAPVTLLFEAATALAILTLVVAVVYGRLSPWRRQAIALSVGSTWLLASFVHHVALMCIRGPEPTDDTGVIATIGGLVVVVAGFGARAEAGASIHAVPSAFAPPSSRAAVGPTARLSAERESGPKVRRHRRVIGRSLKASWP